MYSSTLFDARQCKRVIFFGPKSVQIPFKFRSIFIQMALKFCSKSFQVWSDYGSNSVQIPYNFHPNGGKIMFKIRPCSVQLWSNSVQIPSKFRTKFPLCKSSLLIFRKFIRCYCFWRASMQAARRTFCDPWARQSRIERNRELKSALKQLEKRPQKCCLANLTNLVDRLHLNWKEHVVNFGFNSKKVYRAMLNCH